MDPWTGRGQQHLLSNVLIESLHLIRCQFLSDVRDEVGTSIYSQGWKSGIQLGLAKDQEREWNSYILAIRGVGWD